VNAGFIKVLRPSYPTRLNAGFRYVYGINLLTQKHLTVQLMIQIQYANKRFVFMHIVSLNGTRIHKME